MFKNVTKFKLIGRLYGYNSLLSLGIGLVNLRTEKDHWKLFGYKYVFSDGWFYPRSAQKTTPKTKNQ
jgi:hypothetical protein